MSRSRRSGSEIIRMASAPEPARCRHPIAALLCVLLSSPVLSYSDATKSTEAFQGWSRVETEHFVFIFEPRDARYVDELLTFSEDVYHDVTGFFRSYPKRIPVVLYGRPDMANGFTASHPFRVGLFLTAPTDPWLGARTESWLRLVLTHELTHFVHMTMDRGFFYELSLLFGEAMGANAFRLPGWAIEGPAVYAETLWSSGGRGRNPFFESLYKAPAVEGRLTSLARDAYSSWFPPVGRTYVSGYVLIDYLHRSFGEEVFVKIMDRYLRFPFFGPMSAIRRETGLSASEIHDGMARELAERYRSSSAIEPGALISSPVAGDNYYLARQTDAGLYAYREGLKKPAAIVRMDPGGEEVLLRASLADPYSFSATSDGKTLYFSGLDFQLVSVPGYEASSELYRYDLGERGPSRVSRHAHLWHPAVSGNGASLVAVQRVGPYSRLVEVDTQSGELAVLFSMAETNVYNPVFSPGGTKLAFALNVGGMQDIYVIDLIGIDAVDSRDPRASAGDINTDRAAPVVGPDYAGEYFPVFIDESSLVFSSDRSGNLALYTAKLDGSDFGRIVEDPVAAYAGAVTPDSVVYSSYASTGYVLRKLERSGLRVSPESRSEVEPYPAVSPWARSVAEARRYVDLPRPLLWFPAVSVLLDAAAASDPSADPLQALTFGFGASALGGSILGRSWWQVSALYYPTLEQPELSATLTVPVRAAELQYSLSSAYRPGRASDSSTAYLQELTQGLTLTVPLLNRYRAVSSWSSSLTTSVGLSHTFGSTSQTAFNFVEGVSGSTGEPYQYLRLRAGINGRVARAGASFDLYNPLEVYASITEDALLVLSGPILPESRLEGLAYVNLPSPIRHQVARIGIKTAYATGSEALAVESFAVPRGSFTVEAESRGGRSLFALDYLMPIALLDQPLILGTYLLGVAAGVHVEAEARWGLEPAASELRDELYLGVELAALLGTWSYVPAVPFVLGVSFRVSTSDPGRFDAARDIRLYLALGIDSFSFTTLGARARRAFPGGAEAVSAQARSAMPYEKKDAGP